MIDFECDQVEFDTPVGYQEPKRVMKKSEDDEDAEAKEHLQNHYDTSTFMAFSGEGNRLDGKKKKCDKPEPPPSARVRNQKIKSFECLLLIAFLFCSSNLHLISRMYVVFRTTIIRMV